MLPAPRSVPPEGGDAAEVALRQAAERRELDLAAQRVRELTGERDRLRAELGEERARSSERSRAEATRLEEQTRASAEATRRVQELERRVSELTELEARLDELEAQALEVVTLRAQNSELEARVATLLAAQNAAPKAESAPRGAADGSDDLRRIRGIGPKFAEVLRGNGVKAFADIAAWTDEDIARFARLLRLKPERIAREDWVGGARALLGGGETS